MAKGYLDDILNNIGAVFEGNKGFPAGTHTVKILMAEGETKSIKGGSVEADIITIHVQNPDDEEMIGESTLWFHSEGGAKMAVTKVGGLLVHNAPEEKKETIKELVKKAFKEANDKGDLKVTMAVCLKLLAEKLVGKEAYVFAEPQGDYNTTKYVDIWHYPYVAKETGEKEVVEEIIGEATEDVTAEVDLPDGW